MQSTPQIDEFNAILHRHATRSSVSLSAHGCIDSHAVLSVGKKTMEELENVDLRRRLMLIGRSFPHSDETRKKSMPEKYTELLELARPNPRYPPSVQRHILNLLITQMYLGHTSHLAHALVHLPPADIKLILTSLMRPPIHHDHGGAIPGYTLLDDFDFNSPNVTHLITFLTHAACYSAFNCDALFQGGMLDLFLCLHVYTPPDSVYGECIREACRRLVSCFENPQCLGFKQHPFYVLAVEGDISSKRLAFERGSSEVVLPTHEECVVLAKRKQAWVSIPETVPHRVASLRTMLKNTTFLQSWELWTCLVDLLEFTDWATFGTDIASTSFVALCKADFGREDVLSTVFTIYLSSLPPDRRMEIFRCLIKISRKPFQLSDDPADPHNDSRRQQKPRRAIIHRIIPLFCALAQHDEQPYHKELIDAKVTKLVRSIVEPDIASPFFVDDGDFSETLRHWRLRGDEEAADNIRSAMRIFSILGSQTATKDVRP